MVRREKSYDGTPEWNALRDGKFGGSDAAPIIGNSPFKSRYTLWAEKTGKIAHFAGNATTQVGHDMEPIVAKEFQKVTGKKVKHENCTLFNDKYPWACANLDRVVIGEKAFLEIKTTTSPAILAQLDDEFPQAYLAQCVHYLAVSELEKCYLAVKPLTDGCELHIYELDRDEEDIEALMNAEKDFWYNYVVPDIPPIADGSNSTTVTIGSLQKNCDEYKSADLSDYMIDMTAYMGYKAQIKDLQDKCDEIANRIKVHMGDASGGKAGTYNVSYRTSERTSFDFKQFSKDFPQLDLSAYIKTSHTRPFLIKETNKKGSKF